MKAAERGGYTLSRWCDERKEWMTVKASASMEDIMDEARTMLTHGDYAPLNTKVKK